MNDDGLGSFLWPGTQVPTGTPQGCDMSVFSNGGATIIGSNIPPHPNLDAMMNFVQWQQQAGLAGFNRPQPFPIMPQNPSSVLPNAVTTVPVVENPDSTTATAGAPKKKGRPPGSKNKNKECSVFLRANIPIGFFYCPEAKKGGSAGVYDSDVANAVLYLT
jgi:hypothetical protein